MTARLLTALRTIAAMDGGQLRFRLRGELYKACDRARWTAARPAWRRSDLRCLFAPARPDEGLFLSAARSAAGAGDWVGAHRALSRHFVNRGGAFPLQAAALEDLTERIRARFPAAVAESAARADPMMAGRYDLLGYKAVALGRPPRWQYDPVHHRQAPAGFWAAVPYLDPGGGDHKVIWEINRHQHWLALGRAHHLTGERRYYDEFVDQLQSWLTDNPPLAGVNWASMLELAFRCLSWTWALHLFAATAVDEQEPVAPWTVDLLVGLDRQLTHIERNLSQYFSPNTHLSGEALALYVTGAALPEFRASARRVALGRDVLLREAGRQIRADGGHAELSAHYHRYSTDFYLLALMVARGSQDSAAPAFEQAARAQARYLRAITDDTGRLPLIGDDDGGQVFPVCGREPADCRDTLAAAAVLLDEPRLAVSDVPEEVFWLCGTRTPLEPVTFEPVACPSIGLTESGYYVSRTADGDHLVFDAGPHGFLNGGHAHADALSVVATVGGRPLLIDAGTATYTMDPAVRDRFRSTAMHNTVVVNGRASSQPRGPFHWDSTTDARLSLWRPGDGADYVEARHHGYAPVVHARAVVALHGRGWFILDHFLGGAAADPAATGAPEATAEGFWHLHPDWRMISAPGSHVLLEHRTGRRHTLASSAVLESVRGTALTDLAAYAPAYGRIEPAECLRVRTSGPLPRTVLTVVPMAGYPGEGLIVEPTDISQPPPRGWHAAAYHVRFDDAEVVVLASIEEDGVPVAEGSAPPARWGTTDVYTVGRVALLVDGRTGWEAIVINGRHLASARVRLSHDRTQPFIHAASNQGAAHAGLNHAGALQKG